MKKPKFFTDKFIVSATRFLIFFAMAAITPVIASWISPVMDWLAYGMLRDLYTEIFTVALWGIEGGIFLLAHRRISYKKKGASAPTRTLVASADEYECVEDIPLGEVKRKRGALPWKNVGILTAICVGCIFLVSAIIGFQVKPFYDFGENFTGYERGCAIGRLGRNVFKCIFIAYMLPECKSMAEEIVKTCLPDKKEWVTWLIAGGILLLYGLCDIFASVLKYPLDGTQILLGVAYFVFYAAFTAVYYFTEESAFKSYWLVLLIYMF